MSEIRLNREAFLRLFIIASHCKWRYLPARNYGFTSFWGKPRL